MYNRDDLQKQDDLMHRYLEEGKYPEAIKCAFESLKIAEHLFSPNQGHIAAYLNNIGYLMRIIGRYEDAENYYCKALAIIEKWDGTETPYLYSTLDNLGSMYKDTGRFKEAEPLLIRSITIKRKAYGPVHPEVARSLNELGNLCMNQGQLSAAKKNYKEAIATWEAVGPIGDLEREITYPMLNLGEILRSQGNYLDAEAYISRALDLLLQILPPNHHRNAAFFASLGKLYFGKGEYQKSLSCYHKTFEIYNRVYGEKHPLTMQGMADVAMNLKTLGEFEKSLNFYTKFIVICELNHMVDHPVLTSVYKDMAILHEYLREFDQAEMFYQRILNIKRILLGPDHIDVAFSLENLGHLQLLRESYEGARLFYEKAQAIMECLDPPESPPLVYNYMSIAKTYKHLGKYKNAENFYKKAINTCESALKPDPEAFALAVGKLGSLYQENHNYTKAEEYINRSMQIRTVNITPDHPENVWPLLHLTALHVIRGEYTRAISSFKQIKSLQEQYIDMFFSFAQEKQKISFIDNLMIVYSACLSFIRQFMAKDNEILSFGLETIFQYKGKVIEAESRTVEALLPLLDDGVREIWESRANKLSSLAQLLLGNAPEVTANTRNRKEEISKIQEEIAKLEGALKKASITAARALSRSTVNTAAVADALPDKSALLEFVKIQDFDFENIQDPLGVIRYLVYILKPGGYIELVDLGKAFIIDQTASRVIHSIKGSLEEVDHLLNQLYQLLWAPLEKALQGIDKVVISPDGILGLIPFAALIDNTGKPLLERFMITHVTSGNEIVFPAEKRPVGKDILILAADVDFNYQEVIPLKLNPNGTKEGTFWFKSLPVTLQEAAVIPALIPGDPDQKKVLLKDKAIKNAILNVENPHILHLATPGFSLQNHSDRFFPISIGIPRCFRSLSKMGLALAGANHADMENGNDTGLLTILEITGMELHGTELVVLSACNTGIGEFMTGEGTFAFRKAFVRAGAKNLVMNLWPANEKYTLMYMEEFYKNIVQMPPAEALRQAQLQLIEKLKKEEGYAAPNIWAAFIIQGGQALTSSVFD